MWSPRPARAGTLCTSSRGLQPGSPLFRSPLLPPRRPATAFGTNLGTGNWTNVHRCTTMRLEAVPKSRLTWEDSPPAAGIRPEGRGMTLRRTTLRPSRRERLIRREAHLPTEHPEAGQDTRLPQAHVDPRRAGDPEVPAAQGAPPAHRLRAQVPSPTVGRITTRAAFAELQRSRARGSSGSVRAVFVPAAAHLPLASTRPARWPPGWDTQSGRHAVGHAARCRAQPAPPPGPRGRPQRGAHLPRGPTCSVSPPLGLGPSRPPSGPTWPQALRRASRSPGGRAAR